MARRRLAAALGGALAALALAAPPAVGASPAAIARALGHDPVYVERGADPGLSPAEAGRVRLRIVDKDIGRIKVVVAREGTAQAAGGTAGLANAIDGHLQLKGNLLVAAGSSFHLVTSYSDVGRAVTALRSAVESNENKDLLTQLLAAVDRLAAIDPGPEGDGPATQNSPRIVNPVVDTGADKVFGAVELVILVIGASIALPFIVIGVWLLLRLRRRRREEAEDLSEDRETARDELVALGDEIRELDLDVDMPGANAAGRSEYEQALALYERADRELGRTASARRLTRARGDIAEGRRLMAAAKAALASKSPASPESGR